MKTTRARIATLAALAAATLSAPANAQQAPASAQPTAPAAGAPGQPSPETMAAFSSIVQSIRTKIAAAAGSTPDLGAEIKQIDALVAKLKASRPDEAAELMMVEASIYMEVLNQPDEAIKVVKQIQSELPNTEPGRQAPQILAAFEQMAASSRIQASLAVGKPFPAFEVKDLNGKPLTIAEYAGPGKVVLIDFWAVWCGPCVAELPNVLAAYKKYHDKGFNIIGISLDQDKTKLEAFLKEQGMTWPQYFDGKGWKNDLALKYGVNSIPATYLLDGNGVIIGKNLRGPALEQAVAAALAKK